MSERILVISHAHPDFSLGGGEIAAYNLFKAYKKSPQVDAAFFLARHERGRGTSGLISPRREDEFLWEQGLSDWFAMKAANQESLHGAFSDLVRRLRPTVVHAHHFWPMGLEFLQVIKRLDPEIRIIMTLHEMQAICANNGQMVKTVSHRLCFREGPIDCNLCFPDRSPEAFWLRKHRYQSFFNLVDYFVSPSDFLRGRFIEWGIAPGRIVTIENGQESRAPLPPRQIAEGETRNRFAFFGQINPFKGLHVLLQGIANLRRSERKRLLLEVNGANLEGQEPEFQEEIGRLRKPLEKEGVLQWLGPYEPFQIANRMAEVDWVVVPSLWWENSPMVIQEAFTLGRPVVVSDIGGMAEKIADGVDGVHVPVGNGNA